MIEQPKKGERASLGMEIPVEPLKHTIRVVILQHPQEPDKELGSASLCVRSLKNAELRVGLSWPNLNKALGSEEKPSEWGVLYLGGGDKKFKNEVTVLNRNKVEVDPPPPLKGIIVLDGTWTQAKALWWRNPWFLKLHRVILQPQLRSRYGNLRKEPRKECLSTIESVGLCLRGLGESQKIADQLAANFEAMLAEYRRRTNHSKEKNQASMNESAPSRTASKIPGSQTE